MVINDDVAILKELMLGDSSMVISELDTQANAANNVTITNVAPGGVGTATIAKWLKVSIRGDNDYYIPMWT